MLMELLRRLTSKISSKALIMTQILIVVNIIVYIMQCINPDITSMYVFRSNIWYSYLTACFLHGSLRHLMGNMLFLSFITPVIEKAYGERFILLAYCFTGTMGSVLFAMFLPQATALGASGSICGLMMIWIFHHLINGRLIIVLPALFYFMSQGLSAGKSLFMNSGIGYLAHYGSALGAFFLLPIMLFKNQRD